MRNLALLLLLSATMMVLHSCEEEADTLPTVEYDLVASVTSFNGTTTYTYDAQGRVIREEFFDGSYSTMVYDSGQVTYDTFFSDGLQVDSDVYQLNSDGYIIGGESSTYTYNSDGRMLSSLNELDYMAVYAYQYSNGNLVRRGKEEDPTYFYSFTYLTDKVENRMVGTQTLWGLPSYNLLSTHTSVFNNNPSTTITYTYTYDPQGRVITETRTNSFDGISHVSSYTYFD